MSGTAIASPWKKAPERRHERELKREAVLMAAARVFSERGYHRTSLDAVAQTLNVTKPTLYYYFENKEAMLAACVQHGLDLVEAGGGADPERGATGMARLVAYLTRYAEVSETDFGRCAVCISDAELSEASRRRVRRIKTGIDRRIRDLISAGIADGSIAPSDPKITAFALAGALNSIGRSHQRDADLTGPKMIGQYIALLVNGIAPR